tara:strand:+ start:541 stop:987 length:447 start_codon:yes stop_codon:yes gene_type:complete
MIKLNPTQIKEFETYCKLNEIEDVDNFIVKCSKDGLTLDKYGVAPFLPKSQIQEVPIEKEIVKEVIKEVLVEKEVIVEKIVTKEVDNSELLDTLEGHKKTIIEKDTLINKQKEELKKQEDILEHFKNVTVNRRAKYLKTSNLSDPYLD